MNNYNPAKADRAGQDLAESVREACLSAALRAYEDAGIQGLCQEGRWEAAVSAIRDLELGRLLGEDDPSLPNPPAPPA